jgi:hypothetical protein
MTSFIIQVPPWDNFGPQDVKKSRTSALEATVRKFGVRKTEFVVVPEPGMTIGVAATAP